MIEQGDLVRIYGPITNITFQNQWFEDPIPHIDGHMIEILDELSVES